MTNEERQQKLSSFRAQKKILELQLEDINRQRYETRDRGRCIV